MKSFKQKPSQKTHIIFKITGLAAKFWLLATALGFLVSSCLIIVFRIIHCMLSSWVLNLCSSMEDLYRALLFLLTCQATRKSGTGKRCSLLFRYGDCLDRTCVVCSLDPFFELFLPVVFRARVGRGERRPSVWNGNSVNEVRFLHMRRRDFPAKEVSRFITFKSFAWK